MTQSNTAHTTPFAATQAAAQGQSSALDTLRDRLREADSKSGAHLITTVAVDLAAEALRGLSPERASEIFVGCSDDLQRRIGAILPPVLINQWRLNVSFPEGSVGRLMDPPTAIFRGETTVHAAVATLRDLVRTEFITYAYVVDEHNKLRGVVVMRDLLFAQPEQRLEDIMLRDPFSLRAPTQLMEAMKEVLSRHFPVYPVTDQEDRLIGLVRGYRLFEAQAVEISAQAGSMVGVEKEERLSTPWLRSFMYRHPWLQLNLLTAFIAGAVVNFFQGTIDQIVVLAAFLPVLAGQSGNTGCQALAVTLRGMTLGDLKPSAVPKVVAKEAILGVMNGSLVGLSAALGMYLLASAESNPNALTLSAIVFTAMIGSCLVSGVSGALVPQILRRLGADPATASSIFLTTATDVASMGLLLSLATMILL